MSVATRGRYFFFCSSVPKRRMPLLNSVFCTSTSTPTAGSTREISSTARIAWKKLPPAPPYSSGMSTAMTPISNRLLISASS